MFTYLCRIFHHLHSRPKTVVLLAFAITFAALFPLHRLEFRMSTSELLPGRLESVKLWRNFGKKFGSLGHLTIVAHSQDSSANMQAIRFFAEHLKNHPDVNFLEYRTEANFYKQHKLLYISLKDLQEVDQRIETGFWISKKKRNPLILDLLDDSEKTATFVATDVQDLEKKYFPKLQEYLGTADGKTLVLRLYPNFDIDDIVKCRAFYRDLKTVMQQLPKNSPPPEILLTGDMMRSLQNEGRLYSQIIDSAKHSLFLTGILLLIYFIRIPIGAILAIIPLIMAGVWTLALTSTWIGYLSLVTGPLSLVLIGIGLESLIQLLSRYLEERRKNFSASVAFETLILETGPAITTGVLVSAAAFLTFMVTDFKGFRQFGMMAGVGLLCTLVAVLVVFPCILILIEPFGLIPVLGKRIFNFNLFQIGRYRIWRWHLAAVILITIFTLHRGVQLGYQFNFDKLSFPNQNLRADSLLQAANEAIVSPAVVLTHSNQEAEQVAVAIRAHMQVDTLSPTIQSATTINDLLPRNQDEKLAIIHRLKKMVTPELIESTQEPLKSNLRKLANAWETKALTVADLPENYQKKFLGHDSVSGQFTYIFPSVNLREGWNNIAFAEDVRTITTKNGHEYHASGIPVVQADLLNMIIPDSRRALILALFTILCLVFLDTKSVRGTLILFLPVLFSLIWTLGILKIFNIKLSWYNLVAFPPMLIFAINTSVHLYHRYLEEGMGSFRFVLRRTGETAAIATMVGMATFLGLAFSQHQGLASLGQTALIGLSMSLLAPLLVMPLIIGYLEERGILKDK